VRKGRAEFLTQFPSLATEAVQAQLAPPEDPATFERSRLDLGERERHTAAYALHRDLLALRSTDPVFGSPDVEIDGAPLAERALVLRFFGGADGDRLLLVNLGVEARLTVVNESLLAPPADARWNIVWSSEAVKYGGSGTPQVERAHGWLVPGQAAVALASSHE
jgi:maltooligosyltrehalose trehalohydrolase